MLDFLLFFPIFRMFVRHLLAFALFIDALAALNRRRRDENYNNDHRGGKETATTKKLLISKQAI